MGGCGGEGVQFSCNTIEIINLYDLSGGKVGKCLNF